MKVSRPIGSERKLDAIRDALCAHSVNYNEPRQGDPEFKLTIAGTDDQNAVDRVYELLNDHGMIDEDYAAIVDKPDNEW